MTMLVPFSTVSIDFVISLAVFCAAFALSSAKLLTSWEGMYGTTYLYKFTDDQGNVYIWYASRGIETHDGMTLKGTVKDHNERDGVKQTVLTRCKAA